MSKNKPVVYCIRGKKVMLGADLANLFGVKVYVLIKTVLKNIEKFPADFMFCLNQSEMQDLSHKNVYSQRIYAFTAPGVAALSTVLNSKQAIAFNILVIRSVVEFQRMQNSNKEFPIFDLIGA
jgi:hypothetical protein